MCMRTPRNYDVISYEGAHVWLWAKAHKEGFSRLAPLAGRGLR